MIHSTNAVSQRRGRNPQDAINLARTMLKKKVRAMKNPRRKSHFNGWRTDILRMSKNIPRVHASTVSKAHFLKIADLGGLYQNVCECIASVHESTNPLFQGWCERDFKYEPGFGTKPVANVNKLFLEEVLGIRKDEEGNVVYDASRALFDEFAILLTEGETLDDFLDVLTTQSAAEYTHYFAIYGAAYALLNVPYTVKAPTGDIASVYINVICSSQNTTVHDDSAGAVIVKGGGGHLIQQIIKNARERGFPLVSLRAASIDLIPQYTKMGFHRSLNACVESPPSKEVYKLPYLSSSKNKEAATYSIEAESAHPLDPMDSLDPQTLKDQGYFMTYCVNA